MTPENLCHLIANRKCWIQAGHWFLKNHTDPVASNMAHGIFSQRKDIGSLEKYVA
jgi:hypothetical protein